MRTQSSLFFIFIFFFLSVPAMAVTPDVIRMDGQKITTASAVRLRSAPDVSAAEVGRLTLGTVVVASQRTKTKQQIGPLLNYWYYVQASNQKGWVLGHFLRDYAVANEAVILSDIARTRMDKPDLSFPDRTDLYAFIEKSIPKVKDTNMKGMLELGRALVLQKSLDEINYENQERQPYAAWLAQHKGKVFHDEISGQWMVPVDTYWKLADRYARTRVGDDIAWSGANAMLGGECEGDIACGLRREDISNAEYLRRYPQGLHVTAALAGLRESLNYVQTALQQEPTYFRTAPDAGESIQRLLKAVEGANVRDQNRQQVIVQLKAIQQVYGKR